MNRLWILIGQSLGYGLWIPIWLAIRFTTRTRVLVIHGDEVLVLRGWLSTGAWGLPGGGQHRGEEPAQAAARELQEETGISVRHSDLKPLGQFRQTKGHAHKFSGFVLAVKAKPRVQLQKSEITGFTWVRPADLNKMRTEQHVGLLLDAWQKQR